MSSIYQDGSYLDNNPTWHAEDSKWKADQIIKIMNNNQILPNTVCEIGCGAGEILNQLYHQLPKYIVYYGYEISSQAFELCQKRKKDRLNFSLKDLFYDESQSYDLVLAIDVFEHVEDYFGFLRRLRRKGKFKIFHIPLDLSVLSVLRSTRILKDRKKFGHLHYFTKETALATLEDTGYEILDYFHTPGTIQLTNIGFKASLLKLPRKLLFSLNKDETVKILGGFSLMVLAK